MDTTLTELDLSQKKQNSHYEEKLSKMRQKILISKHKQEITTCELDKANTVR